MYLGNGLIFDTNSSLRRKRWWNITYCQRGCETRIEHSVTLDISSPQETERFTRHEQFLMALPYMPHDFTWTGIEVNGINPSMESNTLIERTALRHRVIHKVGEVSLKGFSVHILEGPVKTRQSEIGNRNPTRQADTD